MENFASSSQRVSLVFRYGQLELAPVSWLLNLIAALNTLMYSLSVYVCIKYVCTLS